MCTTTRQVPYCSLPFCHVVITVPLFAIPWCWQPMAPVGLIATLTPNPSTKTSSRGLRQCCICLVWADSCGGVSNSIVLSLVCVFPFYFSAMLLLHPFYPSCVNHWRTPSHSHFFSPLSPLWQCHYCIALALPGLVWHNHHLALALLAPLSHPHCCYHHWPISLPLPPTYVPHLKCIPSCLSCWCWCQPCSSKHLALTTPMPTPSLFVPHLALCSTTMLSPQSHAGRLNKPFRIDAFLCGCRCWWWNHHLLPYWLLRAPIFL